MHHHLDFVLFDMSDFDLLTFLTSVLLMNCHSFSFAKFIPLYTPARLLPVHIMHTSLVAGWAGSMALYKLAVFDPPGPNTFIVYIKIHVCLNSL